MLAGIMVLTLKLSSVFANLCACVRGVGVCDVLCILGTTDLVEVTPSSLGLSFSQESLFCFILELRCSANCVAFCPNCCCDCCCCCCSRDASRAFVSGNFSGDGLTDDLTGLTPAEYVSECMRCCRA